MSFLNWKDEEIALQHYASKLQMETNQYIHAFMHNYVQEFFKKNQ